MKYLEYLNNEINKAQADFESAKMEAAREIEIMTAHIAVDYGAAYAARIDKITAAAARIKALAEAKRVYEYINGGVGK